MDIFSQHKLLIKTIIVLVVMNIAMMVLFMLKEIRPHHEPLLFPKNEAFKDVSGILEKELKLSKIQVVAFDEIRKRNFEKQSQLKRIIRDDKDAMNVEMFNKNTNVDKINLFARKIAENEYKMELLRFEQAKELKSVCTPEQLEKFEDLVLEIRDYFRPDNQPNKH
jgi:Spy/CpxP family protein refolding chaperone